MLIFCLDNISIYDLPEVGHHPRYKDTRCFVSARTDRTREDFSYHKCVLCALEVIAPLRVKQYQTKWLTFGKA
ncbi:hypothetical protein RJ641_001190 [Dillenia turbinata]|uniref:Uncharacterized protein n=1 Tax=Dillenia turbinata TaxID=194707 RepID=A0AAN8ZS71_9MAGN